MKFAGYVLSGSSGHAHLVTLEGRVDRKLPPERPRLAWMDDVIPWAGLDNYTEVKRLAEERERERNREPW